MRRSSRVAGSSLELLLDTICNTFGGILFLAILIAVLVQLRERTVARQTPSRAQNAQLALGQEQLAAVRDRLATLRAAEAQQERLVRELSSEEVDQLLAEIARLETTKNQLADRKLKSLAEVAELQRMVNDAVADREKLADEGKNLEKAKQQLEQELQEELEARTETARMPTMRPTQKDEKMFCLRRGRIYSLGEVADEIGTGINAKDFEVVSEGSKVGVIPRPEGGLAIPDGSAGENLLTSKLRQHNPRSDYVAVFVWPDSIAEYRLLKPIMLRLGFEIRLIPVPEYLERIYFGAGDVKVQR